MTAKMLVASAAPKQLHTALKWWKIFAGEDSKQKVKENIIVTKKTLLQRDLVVAAAMEWREAAGKLEFIIIFIENASVFVGESAPTF